MKMSSKIELHFRKKNGLLNNVKLYKYINVNM